ncbi:MAG TPA: methyltransferase domain-containing protein [Burkholderiales bacterium]|nr:methyltransferase domain-containing protein [Burkholderiales bacterium]
MDRRRLIAFLATAALALPACAQQAATGLPARSPDVPYVPTKQEVVEEMLRMAGVKPGDVVYDLGCGDGRIVITAAQKFGARGIGVDINPQRIAEADANARRAGVEKEVTFRLGDLFEADIREATVVTLYLLPDVNLRLKPKLLRDLKPGTRVVSHDFSMGNDWKPERTLRLGNDWIYFWTIQ